MKLKNIISVFLLIILLMSCFGSFSVLAAKYEKGEFFIDGEMELLTTGYGRWPEVGTIEREFVHGGEKAFNMKSSDPEKKNTCLQKGIKGLIPGEEYTFSAFIYVKEVMANTRVGLKLEYMNANEEYIDREDAFVDNPSTGKWLEPSVTFVVPEGVATVNLHLRLDNGGEAIFDDVRLYGAMTKETLEFQKEWKEKVYSAYELGTKMYAAEMERNNDAVLLEGFTNPIKNAGFEETDGVKAVGWSCQNDGWGTLVTVTDKEAHSGNNSIKISTDNDNGTTWAGYNLYASKGDFIPGEDHVLSAWVKYESVQEGKGAYMKMEPDVIVAGAGETASGIYLLDDHEWHKINFVFNVNSSTTFIRILIRLRGAGTLYYDDVTFGPIESMNDLMELQSEHFFYTEWGTRTVSAQIDNSKKPIPEGAYVDFAIKDGEKVLVSESVPAKRNTVWEFDVMTMAEMKRPYILEATYKAADGSVLAETKTNEIYRYNRPTALAEDGTYLKDGEPFYPYIAYETIEDYMPVASEIGVNVLRLYNRPSGIMNNPDNIEKMLDDALKNGQMVGMVLYSNGPAGHPNALERTRELVKRFKDHPAVFAWMIQDEPSLHIGPTRAVKTYEEMIHWLKQSYIEIRAIDDHHPVYVLETMGQLKNPYLYTSRTADVFVIDPYPLAEEKVASYVGERTDAAVAAANPEKPVYVVQQTYKGFIKRNGQYVTELYSDNDARHQLYQAALAGAKGNGLYGFTFETDLDNPTGEMDMYTDKEVWEGYKRIKESGELFEIRDHFMAGNSPTFNKYNTSEYRYYSWLKNGDIYTVVMNLTTEDKTVNIDLTSSNGRVKTEGFTGSVINGSDLKTVSRNDNILTVNLASRQVILFKITPGNNIDASMIAAEKYDDLTGFEWAKDAIEMLGNEGIVNDTGANLFSPERNITRGEFAYFLMNTLGISDKAGVKQFDDVDENAFYADAVLAGRKAGILLGNGDGTYNPEDGISRQDAMTICSRAMKKLSMIGVADTNRILGTFTDNGIIADYAADHIAAMVEEEIVKGNPDGTVNPLGNITRAEAAVIMGRILNK